jgi:hypothetical protein
MTSTGRENRIVSDGFPIRVCVVENGAPSAEYTFTRPFRIGRDGSCDIQVQNPTVSRFHLEVGLIERQWWVRDLKSGNGTYVNGQKIDRVPLNDEISVHLGPSGPLLSLTVERPRNSAGDSQEMLSTQHYMQRYFSQSDEAQAGEHTMMIRRAYQKVQKKQKRRYAWIITAVTVLLVAAGGAAGYKHFQLKKQEGLAQDIFYAMKSFEIEQAVFLKHAVGSNDPTLLEQLKSYREKHSQMEQSYQEFVETLDVYKKNISEEDKIILKMARVFGECDINMPDGFVDEVWRYIRKWQSTDRLKKALHRAGESNYIAHISKTLLTYDLPPQFLYLALQESNLNLNICGPRTRHGIAKGMWQFIPDTATYYGLETGPLVEVERYDPNDERHDFEKSTLAAARYIRDIYDTDAQASGLLVMASYNWGETRVIDLIRQLPQNPRERNFWRLLEKYKNKIPLETYDYVFSILSASVIGENPRLFGFDFDNPLFRGRMMQ